MSLSTLNCMTPCDTPSRIAKSNSASATSPRAIFDVVTDPDDVHVVDGDDYGDDSIIEAIPVPVANAHFGCDDEDIDADVLEAFEDDFNSFLDEHPSKLPSQETIEALRARLVKAAQDRVKLKKQLMSQLEEEQRMTNEIETVLTKQIESAKKAKEDRMSNLHEELVEETRSKAASETELKARIKQAEKSRREMEEALKQELYLTEHHRGEDRQPQRGVPKESISGTQAQTACESLHAEHLRIARMKPLPSQRSAATAVHGGFARSNSEGRVTGTVAYAVEPWNVGKSVASRDNLPQAKQLEIAGLSEEVRMLREKWEIENNNLAKLHI